MIKIQNYINMTWLLRFVIDAVLLGVYGFTLYAMVIERWIFTQKRTCIPGLDKNPDGSFKCGNEYDQQLNKPYIKLSVGAPESFGLSMIPYVLLIIFNIIYFNIYKPKSSKNINTSIFIWFLNIIQMLGTGAGLSTIIIHILKYTIGLPRPNTYSNLNPEGTAASDIAFESFPSGHISIGFVNCYIFCIFAQNAFDYALRKNYISPKPIPQAEPQEPNQVVVNPFEDNNNEDNEDKKEEVEEFNGHYWFFLPIFNFLKYIPSLALILIWTPFIGATYVGITRIREYWHHDVDIVAGALIGIACGHLTYKRYYYDIYGTKE